eukprot:TRINITY_DN2167_c0_g1_i1.p1 TRINITY_DN2167_c0_g1~~TRINITY_DN2167_c0_g1_i1.p1  ORF type:complete len:406 (+),score=96.07 TRINITY_DN2167_c0_g1_i1:1718-2935(+)
MYEEHHSNGNTARYTINSQTNTFTIKQTRTTTFLSLNRLRNLFLPKGYPASVTADYARFQLWDTVQAMCSYLRGALCMQALFKAMGVGSADATAASAVTLWIMRDGCGMLGGLTLATALGRTFDSHAKAWRFFADIVNDIGLTLDLMTGLFPQQFLLLTCVASVLKSLCGVAAGATRAALTHHFARANNQADVSATEGSQETLVTLLGLCCGAVLSNSLQSVEWTWAAFFLLTVIHVIANYCGLRALVLNSFNLQRFRITARAYIVSGGAVMLTPTQTNAQEGLGMFAWLQRSVQIGVRLSEMAQTPVELQTLITESRNKHYLISGGGRRGGPVRICLHKDADTSSVLAALFHAEVLLYLQSLSHDAEDNLLQERLLQQFVQYATEAEWNTKDLLIGTGNWRATW